MIDLQFRLARPEDRSRLEELQRRASLAVQEYRDALEAHPDAIHLLAQQIADGVVLVAEHDGGVLGFAAVLSGHDRAELDGLFVEPTHWRRGIGSALVREAVHHARRNGLSLMTVIANPTARKFYEGCGFSVDGWADTRFGPALRVSR